MNAEQKARDALAVVWQSKHDYEEALLAAYPIGSIQSYKLGDNWISCHVTGHSGDDIRVIGSNSGKEYRVSGYRFHQ